MSINISRKDKTLIIEGELTRKTIPPSVPELEGRKKNIQNFDLSSVTSIDPAGAAWLDSISADMDEQDKSRTRETLPESLRQVWDSFSSTHLPPVPETEKISFLLGLGSSIVNGYFSLRDFIVLTADTAHWTISGIFKPGDRRKGTVIQHCYTMGFEALGIIALLSLILGFILALQSAIQLRQYGAGLLAANLLTLALIHEMAPIMTSIIIAGRTGSAVASEIATMEVTEELDALRMMSLNPIRFVLVPKMLAITLVMPLLLTLAIIMGIAGGLIVGVVYLDLTPGNWIDQSISVIVLEDVIRSYAKTLVFSWVIVLIGAHFGFRVKGGSEGVGRATTQSVVASIFSILVLDALFSFTLLL